MACFDRFVNELIIFGVRDCALTVTFSVILLASKDGPVVAFAYDSSSSAMDFVFSVATSWDELSLDWLVASCTIREFVFHFRKLNPPRCITFLDLEDNSIAVVLVASPVTRSFT